MFSNSDEKKLDWMYKGPNALVDREDYLLGRTVDKTLEQLNEEERAQAHNRLLAPPKNHVEHECIPPSIRDYNKIVQNEQVDMQAKLQEDPLVLIKRQEEETRRQFLQNPIQLKKLQEAMQAQLEKKKKHKGEKQIDKKLKKKLKLLKKQLKDKDGHKKLKISNEDIEEEEILDTILMHKFNSLKSKLSEEDLKNIMLGNLSDSDCPNSDEDEQKYFKSLNLKEVKHRDDYRYYNKQTNKSEKSKTSKYETKNPGSCISKSGVKDKRSEKKKLSEEEKEALRRSMMQQATERTKEGLHKYDKYKKEKNKPETITHHGEEFMRQQFLKSANSTSVADRIKSNVNNIQRSKSAMESNFLK